MEKVQVIFNKDFLHHETLAFADAENKKEISERMERGESMACAVYSGERHLFCAVFDFYPDCVHVNLVGGNFGRHYDILETVATGLALYTGVDFISLKTYRRAVQKWAEKQGFYYHEAVNEYMKVVQ